MIRRPSSVCGQANAYALHDVADDALLRRWGISALAIAALHAALIALAVTWYRLPPPPGVTLPAIMVDMSPVSSAPQPTELDLAPGPVMQQADASPPEAAKQAAVEEYIAPTPPQEKPEVVAPPEPKQATPEKPEPAKVTPEQKPTPVKPKVVRPDAKKPSEAPPAACGESPVTVLGKPVAGLIVTRRLGCVLRSSSAARSTSARVAAASSLAGVAAGAADGLVSDAPAMIGETAGPPPEGAAPGVPSATLTTPGARPRHCLIGVGAPPAG